MGVTDKTRKILGYSALVGGIALASLGLIVLLKKETLFGKGLSNTKKVGCDGKFLFVGDSLTAFEPSYADQLTTECPNMKYKKIAKVGMSTDWMLNQLSNELSTGNKYDIVTIWGGTNDIYSGRTLSSAEKNLQAMYDLVRKSGAKVVALTVPPTKTYPKSNDATVRFTDELNKWIRGNSSVSYIDVNNIVNNGNGGTRADYLNLQDSLHLTRLAHNAIMKDYRKKVIK